MPILGRRRRPAGATSRPTRARLGHRRCAKTRTPTRSDRSPTARTTETTRTAARSFGAPTVRKDKNPNAFRSIADNQNYGDDTDCGSLVAPSAHIGLGVNDQDFCDARGKDEVRDIFVSIGYEELSDDGLFESLWSKASAASEFTGSGEVSLQEFRNVLNAYHDSRRKK